MKIIDIKLKNYTVFSDMELSFVKGINVIIGKNGTGKTHLLKTLYSAGVSANGRITFSHKLVRTMMPLNYNISRLASRHRGNQSSNIDIMAIKVASGSDKSATLSLFFNKKAKNGMLRLQEPINGRLCFQMTIWFLFLLKRYYPIITI